MSTTEQFLKEPFESVIDVAKRFAETRSGFAIDLANSSFQGSQRTVQVRELRVQILFALRLLFELINGSKIDRPKPVDASPNFLEFLVPCLNTG